ncbi:flagellar FlbD family protein [Patulibacter defluvii]|uniref:flagellar FlbD family protein n=1 Tax=Patulibacter defluvii TaxID=3095358 RepID=UPI002A765839|nr:flagellar FlbD family protein [Patulibacter sp. DM4]
MIRLHRLAREPEPFLLNPDLIQVVEARPDTTITLTTGAHLPVVESPEQVRDAVARWRSGLLAAALHGAPRPRALAGGRTEEPRPAADHRER